MSRACAYDLRRCVVSPFLSKTSTPFSEIPEIMRTLARHFLRLLIDVGGGGGGGGGGG